MRAKIIYKSYNQNESLLFQYPWRTYFGKSPVRTVVWKGSIENNKARLEAKVDAVLVYRAVNSKGCPFRGMCYKDRSDRRIVKVNHIANGFKRQARELLTNERGMMHRSNSDAIRKLPWIQQLLRDHGRASKRGGELSVHVRGKQIGMGRVGSRPGGRD